MVSPYLAVKTTIREHVELWQLPKLKTMMMVRSLKSQNLLNFKPRPATTLKKLGMRLAQLNKLSSC